MKTFYLTVVWLLFSLTITGYAQPDCTPSGILPGAIAFSGSYNPFAPNTVTSVIPATPAAGQTPVEYIWLKSLVNVSNTVGNPYWSVVTGSQNMVQLGVEGLTQTTYFIRCSRLQGCPTYWGESNVVQVPVDLCSLNYIHPGSINFTGNFIPTATNVVQSTEAASSAFGPSVRVEYIWLRSAVNTPNYVGNQYWTVVPGSQNQVSLTLSGLTKTTYFIRCSRPVSCQMYWGETNIVEVPVDLCSPNYIHPGAISFTGNYIPTATNVVQSTEGASSAFGPSVGVEYIWLRSAVNTPNYIGNPYWTVVPGSQNQVSLTLSGLTKTTYYIRCARAMTCEMYWGETNIATVPVDLCSPDFIHGGTISFSGVFNPNTPNVVTSTNPATCDFGPTIGIEYVWLKNEQHVPFNNGANGWTVIPGSTNASFTLGTLTQTTYFIRCARAATCEIYWGESNIVGVTVDRCLPEFTHGGEIQHIAAYNPNATNVITSKKKASSDFGDGVVMEYRWYSTTTNLPFSNGSNGWSEVVGGTDPTLKIPLLTATTRFIRTARVTGCNTFIAQSNIVEVEVNACAPDYFVTGSISFEQGVIKAGTGNIILSKKDASSPYGPVEYAWAVSTTTSNTSQVIGNPAWSLLPDRHSPELPLLGITQLTYYVRLARLAGVGCVDYVGVSNVITVVPAPAANASTSSTSTNRYAVYPVPALAGQPTVVQFINTEEETLQVRILNLAGSQSSTHTYPLVKHEVNRISISLDGLSAGLYVMEIRAGNTAEIRRLMIR